MLTFVIILAGHAEKTLCDGGRGCNTCQDKRKGGQIYARIATQLGEASYHEMGKKRCHSYSPLFPLGLHKGPSMDGTFAQKWKGPSHFPLDVASHTTTTAQINSKNLAFWPRTARIFYPNNSERFQIPLF